MSTGPEDPSKQVNKKRKSKHVTQSYTIVAPNGEHYNCLKLSTSFPTPKDYLIDPHSWGNLTDKEKTKIQMCLRIRNLVSSLVVTGNKDEPFLVAPNEYDVFLGHRVSREVLALRSNYQNLLRKHCREIPVNHPLKGSANYLGFMEDDDQKTAIESTQKIIKMVVDQAAYSFYCDYLGFEKFQVEHFRSKEFPQSPSTTNIWQAMNFSVHTARNTKIQKNNVVKFSQKRQFKGQERMSVVNNYLNVLTEMLNFDSNNFKKNEFPSDLVSISLQSFINGMPTNSSSGWMMKVVDGVAQTPQKITNFHIYIANLEKCQKCTYIDFEFVRDNFLVIQMQTGKTEVRDHTALDYEKVEKYYNERQMLDKDFFDNIHLFLKKCRSINTSSPYSNIMNNVFMKPLKEFTSKNLPFYYGFSLTDGAANDIMRMLHDLPKIKLQNSGFSGLFFFDNSDIGQFDWLQKAGHMQNVALYYLNLFWDLSGLREPIQPTDSIKLQGQKKVFSVLMYVLSGDFSPQVYNVDAERLFETTAYMSSGIPWTSMIQSITAAILYIHSVFLAFRNLDAYVEKLENIVQKNPTMGQKERAKINTRILRLQLLKSTYYTIFMKTVGAVVMGDNTACLFPLEMLPFFQDVTIQSSLESRGEWIDYDRFEDVEYLKKWLKNPRRNQPFQNFTRRKAMEDFGFPYKPEETCMGFFDPPQVFEEYSPDWERGIGRTINFCSRDFRKFQLLTTEDGVEVQTWLSSRPLDVYCAKVAPQNQFKSLAMYLIRVNSLIRDNCLANPHADYFLRYIAESVKRLMSDDDWRIINLMKEMLQNEPERFYSLYKGSLSMGSQDMRSYFYSADLIDKTPIYEYQRNKLITFDATCVQKKNRRKPYAYSDEQRSKMFPDMNFTTDRVIEILEKYQIDERNLTAANIYRRYYGIS